ncbi:MAG: beta-phosphoglucomutase [Acholeplasmataceae bacterium]|jgi:beta-phosphoglucomutase|nr:beta-phosphoglucomutase [Acholeplasmataceae bacterium]
MIKAVIFDLDGVIVNTDELHYKAWKKMADTENISFDQTINHRLRGVSRMESLDIILEKSSKTYSRQEKDALATFKNNVYVELLKGLSSKDILDGVVEVIQALKSKNIKVAIGSSSKNTPLILEYIGIKHLFDAVADGNQVIYSKPAPDVFLKAADMLKIEPTSCAVVEDAIAGIEAAKRANMLAIAVSEARKSPRADYRFDDIKQILTII